MTENKRFTLMWKPETTFSRFWIARDNGKQMNAIDVVDLLNKQEEDYLNVIMAWKELDDKHKELKEENEQLKQAYNDAKKDVEKKEQILKEIMEDNILIQDMRNELKE